MNSGWHLDPIRKIVQVFASCITAATILAAPAQAAPQRVVSINLCTDQLAMLLAAPGQLVSVTALAQNPEMSAMAEEALAYPANHARAEEIYLLRPDLVLAGEYSTGPTVAMLRRLGVRVEVLPPAESIPAIRDQITHIGTLLDREAEAADLLARFDTDLKAATEHRDRGRAALYYANSFTSGGDTLAGTIVTAAGFRNIADDYGIRFTSPLPLELLVMSRPDRLITGAKWPGQSRSEAILDHPALAMLSPEKSEVTDADWVCGTPAVLNAIRSLE
ncbi:ABC transporter substrate-binding protein [Paracoccus caeni]|uniref:ABC transporter substrate-binding protein n=1 Tax=Paracoccus caeni TaxID=657651 RepID=UPI002D7FD61E|nr:ABC transporter substrate-binding protein [Paracoccus caeni]